MKTKYSSIFALILIFLAGFNSSKAQVIAGTIPAGGYTVDPNMSFSVVNFNEDTTGSIDLNCDNIPDMTLQLYKGQTAIDGENAVFLYVHNPIYSICADTNSSSIRRINVYALADTINCNGSFAFTNDTIYKLGDYGCFGCIGPWSISEKYIAYSNGINTGWIKVTYDLMDGGTAAAITFSSNEFLTYCNPNSVDDMNGNNGFQIIPNPTTDGIVNLQYKGKINSVEVFNSIGQKVEVAVENTKLTLPNEKGIYFVRFKDEAGNLISRKVVRD